MERRREWRRDHAEVDLAGLAKRHLHVEVLQRRGGYSTIASTMLRVGSRLGLQRRANDVTPSLADYLA